METAGPAAQRELRTVRHDADLVVVGGGMAGSCSAITAARAGLKVVLVQDRPVLGGNASSEVRLWILGATAHMGNNNRWSREGGVIDEILLENLYRNPEGNALILDTIVLEKVVAESGITLLLNTAVFDATKADGDVITSLRAFCSQNSTMYALHAPLFCDASGDGIVGFLAGAAFRMGAESCREFGEKFAPNREYGELLGHTIYFYTRDTGRPVTFVSPAFALDDISKIPRYRRFNTKDFGCQLWWIEFGGRLDTVHETEAIKWELWKIVYGVWNHIKNSGDFPDAANLTLEWVGTIPGKRESRRFEGDVMLTQQDVVEQRRHDDAVSFGGWALDLHPADGVFTEKPGCNQWHSQGVYEIPYRCLYSRNIRNLFLAGRIISASHVAFGSTRVMATCAHNAQAVGMAAALCSQERCLPRDVLADGRIRRLQDALLRCGQYIPNRRLTAAADLAQQAEVLATSELILGDLPASGPWLRLEASRALLLPMAAGRVPRVSLHVRPTAPTYLQVQLRTSSRMGNYTPDVVLAERSVALGSEAIEAAAARRVALAAGALPGSGGRDGDSGSGTDWDAAHERLTLDFGVDLDEAQYVFVCLMANPNVEVCASTQRVTGVLAVTHKMNGRVAESATQTPPPDIGVDSFEFWRPERRPGGLNLAARIDPPLTAFTAANVTNGVSRPTRSANAWVADPADPAPALTLRWDEPQTVRRIELSFDTDFDHPLESVLMHHPERVVPFCVRRCSVVDDRGREIARIDDNHQTRRVIELDEAVTTRSLRFVCAHPTADVPAALFDVRCYAS
ncbi:MAG TPA: FAD-dependent oxidoreductase [Phycisphaerae bacterium]|nr:FAD-dependent oxidoreductase [Phycisphaerae bacterium]